jgi:hypothetical protein
MNRFPGVSATLAQDLSYSVQNRFQARVRSGGAPKAVDLLNWSLSGSYNLLAARRGEDRPASNIVSAIDFNRIRNVSLNLRTTHNPYAQLRVESLSLQGNMSLAGTLPGAAVEEASPGAAPAPEAPAPGFDTKPSVYKAPETGGAAGGEALGWNGSLSVSFSGFRQPGAGLDTRATANGSLGVNLTRNWGVRYTNSYDFEDSEITYQGVELTRELHCWQATFSYRVTPLQNEFYFRVNVKALPDIKFETGPGLGATDTFGRLAGGAGF